MTTRTTSSLPRIPMQERTPSSETSHLCEGLFPDSSVRGNTSSFTYSTRNDFGREIKALLFCSPKQGFSSDYFANMQEIGEREGFDIVQSAPRYSVYMVRDPKLTTTDGHFLEPTCSESTSLALERAYKRSMHLKNHSAVLSQNPSMARATIGTVAHGKLHQRTGDGIKESQWRDSRLYFEGGDTFHLTNQEGVPKYLFGEDLATTTHQTLRRDKWFGAQAPSQSGASYLNENLLLAKYGACVNKWFIRGEIPGRIEIIAREISVGLDDDQINAILLEMNSMGLLVDYQFETESDKSMGRAIATQYLAQRQFVETEIFPAELGCKSSDVVFLPQVAYHLDLMMAPGPKGSVFLQDYDLAVRVLQTMLDKASELGLSQQDVKQLENFIETTSKVGDELKPLMAKAKEDLEKAGFTVIPAPGAFFSLPTENQSFNINFMNCLTGYSSKTSHYYYIAPGVKTGGQIGELLMDSYVEFLKHHCGDIAVYFAGRKPEDDTDFEEATYDMNRQRSQLAVHCLSYELKIAPHTEKN